MAKRYTKDEREDAAKICATMASSNHHPDRSIEHMINGLDVSDGHAVDLSECAEVNARESDLARAAYWNQRNGIGRRGWAEAEAMLRCGWSPT